VHQLALQVSAGDGQELTFLRVANGTWTSAGAPQERLESRPNGGYRFTSQVRSSVTDFDATGRPVSQTSSSGKSITFTFFQKHLQLVQDSFGRSHSFEMATFGQEAQQMKALRRITDPTGRSVEVLFTNGNLTSVTWPAVAYSRGFAYDRADLPWALTGTTSEYGRRISSFGYDSLGNAISTEGAGAVSRYSMAYSQSPAIRVDEVDDGLTLTRELSWQLPIGAVVTNPLNQAIALGAARVNGMPALTERSQPAGSGCAASTSAQTYDTNGNIATSDDFNGNRTCYANDLTRNLETTRVEGLAAGAACTATASGAALPAVARKTSTQWHPDWSLRTRQSEPGRITTWVYNGQPDPYAAGALASCAPASAVLPDGKPIAVLCRQVEQATVDADGSQGFAAALQAAVPAREQKWTYNAFGQVLTHDGPRTDVADITVNEYYADTSFTGADPNAVGHTLGDLKQTTSPAGHITRYTLYDKLGQVLQMQDPNGVATNYTYDARQRLTSTSTAGQTTVFEYWPTGLPKRTTQADLSWVQQDYDDAHRLVRVSDSLGNSISYTLDNMGNRTAEEVRDPSNSLRRVLSRSIDALGRVQQVTGRE
jgi:YD repeat-containing protein